MSSDEKCSSNSVRDISESVPFIDESEDASDFYSKTRIPSKREKCDQLNFEVLSPEAEVFGDSHSDPKQIFEPSLFQKCINFLFCRYV